MTRELLMKIRKIATPISIAALAFYVFAPKFVEGLIVPLPVTLGLLAIALASMFAGMCSGHYALNYDGNFKRVNSGLILYVIPPFLIGLNGAAIAGLSEDASGTVAIILMVAMLLVLGSTFFVSARFTKVYGPLYDKAQRDNANAALADALDSVPNLSAAARISIEARMEDASTEEVKKMATSIKTIGETAPELLA